MMVICGHFLGVVIVLTINLKDAKAGFSSLVDGAIRGEFATITRHGKGATAKAAELKVWLAGLVATYDDKIIPIDPVAAALAGQLEAKAISAGPDLGMTDASMAGIAKTQDFVILAPNTKHFAPFGIKMVTPEEAARP